MREKPKDNTRLRHMLEAINNVIEFTTDVTFEEYSRNKILRFAVIKNLEIVGEAAYLITKEFREELYGDILRLYDEMEQTGKAEIKMVSDKPDEPEFTVRVTPFEREGSNMVGLANIVLNDSFAVGNVSVVQGRNGIFVAMPSYKSGNKYKDVCFPITKEFREKVNNAVLETYQQAKEQALQESRERASRQIKTDDRGFMAYSGEPLPFR